MEGCFSSRVSNWGQYLSKDLYLCQGWELSYKIRAVIYALCPLAGAERAYWLSVALIYPLCEVTKIPLWCLILILVCVATGLAPSSGPAFYLCPVLKNIAPGHLQSSQFIIKKAIHILCFAMLFHSGITWDAQWCPFQATVTDYTHIEPVGIRGGKGHWLRSILTLEMGVDLKGSF